MLCILKAMLTPPRGKAAVEAEVQRLVKLAGADIATHSRVMNPEVLEILRTRQRDRQKTRWMDEAFSAIVKSVAAIYNNDRVAIMEVTGLTRGQVAGCLRIRSKWEDPRIPEQEIQHKLLLEEQMYQGRKELTDAFLEGARRALDRATSLIPSMTAGQATTTSAVFTDKALLLSGQPTSRVARIEERMMSDEELRDKLMEYDRRLGSTDPNPQLKVVHGTAEAPEGSA